MLVLGGQVLLSSPTREKAEELAKAIAAIGAGHDFCDVADGISLFGIEGEFEIGAGGARSEYQQAEQQHAEQAADGFRGVSETKRHGIDP